MLKSKQVFLFLLSLVLIASGAEVFGQVYSYVDQNGVRVFTNIAPSGTVADLKVSFTQPPPSPAAVASKQRQVTTNRKSGQLQLRAQGKPVVQKVNDGQPAVSDSAEPIPNASGVTGEYAGIIEKYAAEYGVDPMLIHSMIATESAFNSRAVSPKGAQGLMQLMPATASRLGVRNPFDPEENIAGGIKHMRSLLDMFSDSDDPLILSLAAYNAGENLVQKLGRMPAIHETNEYVTSIIQRYGKRSTAVQTLPAIAEPELAPRMYQYVDENGTQVYTNLPPVIRSGGEAGKAAGGPRFR